MKNGVGQNALSVPNVLFVQEHIKGVPKPLAFSILSFLIISDRFMQFFGGPFGVNVKWRQRFGLHWGFQESCDTTDFAWRPLGLLRFHKQVDVFGRPIAPCIYDMNQFQGKIQKKLQAQMLLQLSSHHQSARPFLCCTLAASPPCPFPSPGISSSIFVHRKKKKNVRSWRGKGMKKLKLKKLKGKKKSFPKSTKPVGLRSRRCCWHGRNSV